MNYIIKDYKKNLPLNYFLLIKLDNEAANKTERFSTSKFHQTDYYVVGNIYRPICNIL